MHIGRLCLAAATGAAVLIGFGAFIAEPAAGATQDKYTLKVPGGLAFAEFKGYETWEVVAVSNNQKTVAVILANPVMIAAYKAGIPANGKPFPTAPRWPRSTGFRRRASSSRTRRCRRPARRRLHGQGQQALRTGRRLGICRVRLRRRDRHVQPGTTADNPPQANDAKCGVACHTIVKKRDFVFTEYGHR
jgi:hypothetical protein